jgi:4-nitrophenyl phosphatase
MPPLDLSAIDGIVSDMDGVLWRGDTALPGLVDLFAHVRRLDLPIALATNNSSKSQAEYVDKLRRLGVEGVAERQIVTSRTVLLDYLADRYAPGTPVHVIGSPGFAASIAAAGYRIADVAGVVVVGIDIELSYSKLKRAALLIREGADFLGTNGDLAIPSSEGMVPGNGAILAALQAATGKAPEVMGKPAPAMYRAALRALGSSASRTLMIGDRLDTDIAGARASGLKAALVLTGATDTAQMKEAGALPDGVFGGLPDLLAAWTTTRAGR